MSEASASSPRNPVWPAYLPGLYECSLSATERTLRVQHLCTQSPFSDFSSDYVRLNYYRYRENVLLFLLAIATGAEDRWILTRDVLLHIIRCGHWPALVESAPRRQYRAADYTDEQLRDLPLWPMLWKPGSVNEQVFHSEISLYEDALLHRINTQVYVSTLARAADGAAYIDFGSS